MTKEYIDREAFKDEYLCCGYLPEMSEDEFDAFPAADVVEVVRCKDCRYRAKWNGADLCFNPYYKTAFRIKKNGFCSDGKRREGVDNG